jgi:hypothetical protein
MRIMSEGTRFLRVHCRGSLSGISIFTRRIWRILIPPPDSVARYKKVVDEQFMLARIRGRVKPCACYSGVVKEWEWCECQIGYKDNGTATLLCPNK